MKFTLGPAQDVMPAIELETRGQAAESILATWRSVASARAYYLHAMGGVGEDMVLWSSSETGDTGMGLFEYLPNATIDRWLKERVLLQPETTRCNIPKGIFAGPGSRAGEGGMLRMMAYGPESNFAYPPRPSDPKAVWEPEWAVRVRVTSHTMAALGEDGAPSAGAQRTREAPPVPPDSEATAPPPAPRETEATTPLTLPLPLPNPAGVLRGIFGR
jgi:hypothetical protein